MSTTRELDVAQLVTAYTATRQATEQLCAPLAIEDYVIQATPDVSPTKWHLAHVTWFFETFLLKPHLPGYEPIDPQYAYLFNSYYNGVGPQSMMRRSGSSRCFWSHSVSQSSSGRA